MLIVLRFIVCIALVIVQALYGSLPWACLAYVILLPVLLPGKYILALNGPFVGERHGEDLQSLHFLLGWNLLRKVR